MATNLNKLNEKERLQLCRRYFLLGFAFLPILWLVNFIWFYRYTFGKKYKSDENVGETNNNLIKEMKRYVLLSAIGTLIWAILLICWVYIYQIERSLGNVYWAEMLTYIYPIGYV